MALEFARISRAQAEKIYISVRNIDTKQFTVGHVAHWNYVATTAGVAATGDGYSVTHALTAANGQLNPAFAAGIIAGAVIYQNEYGRIQVFGPHSNVSVAGVNGAAPFIDLFTAKSNTDSHFRLHVLKPVNAFGNTTGAVTNAGYMAPVLLVSTISITTEGALTCPLGCYWPGGYAIPLSNPLGDVTIDTDSTGSVQAFCKFLG